MIATTNEPKLTLGELAVLTVADVGRMGAFLDWGLEKDLFLPFKEQTEKVEKGDQCLVSLYIDKSERLCATMKITFCGRILLIKRMIQSEVRFTK